MDLNNEEDSVLRSFQVLSSIKREEYILSDPVRSGASPSPRSHPERKLEASEQIDYTSDEKTRVNTCLALVKNEPTEVDFGEEFLTKEEEAGWKDVTTVRGIYRSEEHAVPEDLTLNPNAEVKIEPDSKIYPVEGIVRTLVPTIQDLVTPDIKYLQGAKRRSEKNSLSSRKTPTFSNLSSYGPKRNSILKRNKADKCLPIQQSSRRSKDVAPTRSKVAVDRPNMKLSLVNVPINVLLKNMVNTTQNAVNEGTSLGNRTNSKEIIKTTTKTCNTLPNSLTSSEITSHSVHSSGCECSVCEQNIIESNKSRPLIPRREFVCKKCNKCFISKIKLNRHISLVHYEEKKFVCYHCCKAYPCKSSLDYHILSRHNLSADKPKCEKCDKCFVNKSALRQHFRRNHSKTEVNMPEACDICQKVFRSRVLMLRHKLLKHNTSNKKLICNDCSAVFSDKYALIRHIQASHMPPQYKCSQCSEEFFCKLKLKYHLRKHGKEYKKTFVCETCGKTIKGNYGLQNHIKTHTDIKQYVCEECGKSFRTVSNLQQHSHIHSDVRRFSCDLCNKAFRIRHHLQQHMAVHGMASTPNYSMRARRKKAAKRSDSSNESSSGDLCE